MCSPSPYTPPSDYFCYLLSQAYFGSGLKTGPFCLVSMHSLIPWTTTKTLWPHKASNKFLENAPVKSDLWMLVDSLHVLLIKAGRLSLFAYFHRHMVVPQLIYNMTCDTSPWPFQNKQKRKNLQPENETIWQRTKFYTQVSYHWHSRFLIPVCLQDQGMATKYPMFCHLLPKILFAGT